MMRSRRVRLIILVAAIVVPAALFLVLSGKGKPDLSDSRWLIAAMEKGMGLQDRDFDISAAYRILPDETRFEIVYACAFGPDETREFYLAQLVDAKDEGSRASIRLSGTINGRSATVRNYHSDVSNIYSVTLEADPEEAKRINRAVDLLPEARIIAQGGALGELLELEGYGGFLLYNLDPFEKRLPFDKPALSRAFIASGREREAVLASVAARLGLAGKDGAVVGELGGFAIELQPFRTDAGIDLITVRIQGK